MQAKPHQTTKVLMEPEEQMSGASSERLAKQGRKGRPLKEPTAWMGFVDINLTDDDKASLAQQQFEAGDAFSFMEDLVEDGYKVSLSADSAHACYIAAATGSTDNNPNRGYTLSGRGPSPVGAVASLAYKHCTLCQQGVWTNFVGSTTASKWG